MTTDLEWIEKRRQAYKAKQCAVDEVVVEVLLDAYTAVTGHKASERFREKIEEVVAYDQ